MNEMPRYNPAASITPNMDRNQRHLETMAPHKTTAAAVLSGCTDICILLNKILIELAKLNDQVASTES